MAIALCDLQRYVGTDPAEERRKNTLRRQLTDVIRTWSAEHPNDPYVEYETEQLRRLSDTVASANPFARVRAQENLNEENALKMEKRLSEGQFDLEDFLDQLKQVKRLGPITDLLGMIPGMSKIKNVNVDEREFVKTEAIINSMTKRERENYHLLNGSRRRRIANGSGTSVSDVNRVIKQYVELKKMLKMFKGKKNIKLPRFF